MEERIQLGDTIEAIVQKKGTRVWSVAPDDSVYRAIEMMAEKQIGALLVMSGDELVGIISERDYARKVILLGRHSKETPVSEVMTSPVLTVSPMDTIDECMRIMTAHRIRHLPVQSLGRVVGLISIGDLVNWIISSHEATIHHLQSYIAGSYPV